MSTDIRHFRNEAHMDIGEVIERGVGVLVDRWIRRAQNEQPTAARAHRDVLVDHLPIYLTELGRSLATAGDDSEGPRREAREHGDQRWDSGWSVIEVVRDYQILRVVICEFLEESLARRLGVRESLVLNVSIDDAIAFAVSSFADSQAAPRATAATRNEALDLLLNVLGVVGHELRNPLAPLANSLEILRLVGNDPVQLNRTREMMGRQLRVLGRLVEDLMDLPRLARGKLSLVRERFDLAGLVRLTAEDRRKGLESAGLTLTVEVPPDPVWVVGDETRLTQTLGNLLGNAQKFTDRGGTVAVRMTVTGDGHVVVAVKDTGIGIDTAVLPKVFEAYTQADDSLHRTRGGMGLGLALVKGVVELHGGTVTAASDGRGTGSVFTVTLPTRNPLMPLPDQPGNTAPPHVRRRRVLIIEDNPDSAESLMGYLTLHGHFVQIAPNGSVGLELIRTFAADAVICDIGLPDKNGYEVAAEIRRTISPVPELIVAISGHTARNDATGRPDSVFDYYLLKPAEPARILQILNTSKSSSH
jgi:signal transduction histidine kinase/ActR/RegA family two-component response regulator